MKMWVKSAAVPRFARERFAPHWRLRLRRIGFVHQFGMQPVEQRVQFGENLAAVRGADRLRKFADRRIGLRQGGVAQEQARRKPLDGAAHHAVGVLGLHFAVDLDAQFAERPIGGEHVGDVAEGVLMGGKPRVGRYIDAPAHHVLAVVIARRQPQHLDRARGRRIVAIDRAVGDAHAHGR